MYRIPVQMGRIFRMQGVFLTWFCSTQSYRKSLIDNIKQNLANEMLRVLKPDDLVLWYDFWHNPTTPHARGLHPVEIRRLFPNCSFDFLRITLAPPIIRPLCYFLSWVASFWRNCASLSPSTLSPFIPITDHPSSPL